MDFLKGNNDQTQANQQSSGGGGLMGKMNSAFGGGQTGEKNEGHR